MFRPPPTKGDARDLLEWLASMGLEPETQRTFKKFGFKPAMFKHLDNDLLEHMGVQAGPDRARLLLAARYLQTYQEHLLQRKIENTDKQGGYKCNFIITLQEDVDVEFYPFVREKLNSSKRFMKKGADMLAANLIRNIVIRNYKKPLLHLVDEVDRWERMVLRSPPGILGHINSLKINLMRIRRRVLPLWDALEDIMATEDDVGIISDAGERKLVALRGECNDILVTVTQTLDQASGIIAAHLAIIGQKTNDTMRLFTVVGAIFMPLSFLAGLEGMKYVRACAECGCVCRVCVCAVCVCVCIASVCACARPTCTFFSPFTFPPLFLPIFGNSCPLVCTHPPVQLYEPARAAPRVRLPLLLGLPAVAGRLPALVLQARAVHLRAAARVRRVHRRGRRRHRARLRGGPARARRRTRRRPRM